MTLSNPTPLTWRRAGLRLGSAVVDLLLWTYSVTLSPLLGPSCRFAPSCSQYARESVARYGVMRGSWLGLKRVLRCHPFHPGGWDPVV